MDHHVMLYAFVLMRRQERLTTVCLPGWTRLPLPYFLGTVQNGAHLVCLPSLVNRFFLLGCLYRAIA